MENKQLNRRSQNAIDEMNSIYDALISEIEDQEGIVNDLSEQIQELKEEIRELNNHIKELTK